MKYAGEIQTGVYMCVFASVVGAINSIADKTVWTQQSLLDKWREEGHGDGDLNFGNIMPVAIDPVRGSIKFHQHVDGSISLSDEEYLKLIRDCIDRGGVVVVSFQHADPDSMKRKQGWHMISLVGRTDDTFEAWDTAGSKMMLTAKQLVTHFEYGSSTLMVHDKHDMLLIEPI